MQALYLGSLLSGFGRTSHNLQLILQLMVVASE